MIEKPLGKGDSLQHCSACRHIQRSLDFCQADARNHAWGGSTSYDRIRNALTFRAIKRHLNRDNPQDQQVLEIGFGAGHLLRKFIEAGYQAAGVERNMLEIQVDPLVKSQAELYTNIAEDQNIPANRFDLINGIHVIEHLDNPQAVYKSAHRLLKTGGILYLITPNAESKGLSLFKDKWWNLEDPSHIRFYSPASIRMALQEAGFRDIRVHVPRWDSLTLEVNSFMRIFHGNKGDSGVLGRPLTKFMDLLLLPLMLLLRLAYPKICPSIEIIAYK
jgi:SAM-dependent methyltransferase